MYQIDFKTPIHVHFIGIGGISMSGLAKLLYTNHFIVSGSDAKQSKVTKQLEEDGIHVVYGQRASNITKEINLVVYTAAVKEDNPEFIAAKEAQIPMLDRAQLLGQIMKHYKNSIGIAGTHGKTTVTSMLSLILLEGGFDPTISVGGLLEQIKGNIRIGASDYFVVESCEYTDSFLKLSPKHEIILNIEAEHLDYFKNLEAIRNSFRQFAAKLPSDGILVMNGEIEKYEEIINGLPCRVLTYGINDTDDFAKNYGINGMEDSNKDCKTGNIENSNKNYQTSSIEDSNKDCKTSSTEDSSKDKGKSLPSYNYVADHISFDEFGRGQYGCYKNGEFLGKISLGVIGLHNISNSLAALALADSLGVPFSSIQTALTSFIGTERRFEKKGEIKGITIVDDYAHHPSEIKATLSAAKCYPHNTLWCVFQPHTYSRTKLLLKDFAKSLSLADKIVLADIYSAREKDPGDISSKDLLKEIEKLGKPVYYFPCFDDIENFLLQECTSGDLLITMGAGDVVMIGESLLGK